PAPFCIFLFTSTMRPLPPGTGKSEVRKAKPLISPRTRRRLRSGQVLSISKGTRAMIQLSVVPSDSSRAVKDFLSDALMEKRRTQYAASNAIHQAEHAHRPISRNWR